MTKAGMRLDDIGPGFTWPDLRDFIAFLPLDSALFRARNPKSWWWTPEHDFLGAIVTSLQWANWQRGGGKGDKPRPIKRPQEKVRSRVKIDPQSADELAAKRERLKRQLDKGGT